jgi:AraC-like DNA-binding protein
MGICSCGDQPFGTESHENDRHPPRLVLISEAIDLPDRSAGSAESMTKKNVPLKGYIYYWYDASLLLLDSFTSARHRHYPIEFYVGLEAPFEMDFGEGWQEYRAVIVDSNQNHRFMADRGWQALVMMDPGSRSGECLRREILRGNRFRELDAGSLSPLISAFLEFKNAPRSWDDARHLCDDLLRSFSNDAAHVEPYSRRVIEIIHFLRDLPEKRIKAEEVAHRFSLSESRMAHLFKNETGTSLRRYLVWLRLMEAIKLIAQGMSFTDAAYEAGFADSAHLSRTYKELCGLNPSDLLNRSPSIRIITGPLKTPVSTDFPY